MDRAVEITAGLTAGYTAYAAVADDYDRLRPGYPPALLEKVLGAAEIVRGGLVADVAAGTGKLGAVLAGLGRRVVAVEPVGRMRARIPVGGAVSAVAGVAERLPLRSEAFDAVVVGQAWHWFDAAAAAREAHRVLRPGGVLAVVTNVLDTSVPWAARVDALRGGRPVRADVELLSAQARAGRWRRGGELTAPHVHRVARDAVADLVLTTSSLADASPAVRDAVAAKVVAIGREHGLLDRAEIEIPFVLRARWEVRAA